MPDTVPSRRKWRTTLGIPAAIVLTLVGMVVYQGSRRESTGVAAGTSFEGRIQSAAADSTETRTARTAGAVARESEAASAPETSDRARATGSSRSFRIGTFNIHHGQGLDGRLDLARTAQKLRGCDFVGLQEVWGPHVFRDTQQARDLGETLGMSWLYAPTERRWWHEHGGNGALSKLAVRDWLRIPLVNAKGRSTRNCLLTVVEVAGRPVRILATHLEAVDRASRDEQLRIVRELYLSLEAPAVLLGDFNTRLNEPGLAELLVAEGVIDALAISGSDEKANAVGQSHDDRIDHIFVRGLTVLRSGIEPAEASDHPFAWADCELP